MISLLGKLQQGGATTYDGRNNGKGGESFGASAACRFGEKKRKEISETQGGRKVIGVPLKSGLNTKKEKLARAIIKRGQWGVQYGGETNNFQRKSPKTPTTNTKIGRDEEIFPGQSYTDG